MMQVQANSITARRLSRVFVGTGGGNPSPGRVRVCMFITAGPMIKLCGGGEGDSEGHVL
jgi:hypothetical protein